MFAAEWKNISRSTADHVAELLLYSCAVGTWRCAHAASNRNPPGLCHSLKPSPAIWLLRKPPAWILISAHSLLGGIGVALWSVFSCCRVFSDWPPGPSMSVKGIKTSKAEEMGRISLSLLRTHNTSSSAKAVDKWQSFPLKADDFYERPRRQLYMYIYYFTQGSRLSAIKELEEISVVM